MWPWGHLAVAYLAYSALSRSRLDAPPRAGAALAVAVGSQAPDLVDKPLAWTFALLPSGRSMAHSLLFAALVLLAVTALGRRYNRRRVAAAFGLGHVSHLLADALLPLWTGEYASLAYFVWPLAPLRDPPSFAIIPYILSLELTPYAWLQFGLFAVAFGVWVLDGTPGLDLALRALPRRPHDVE